jgi:hypothetical protein
MKYDYTTIGAVLALVVLIIGFIGPWYTISVESSVLGKASIDVGLLDTTFSGQNEVIDLVGSVSIDSSEINNTMYIALITLILAVITLLGILGTVFEFKEISTMQKIGEICGFLTFITAIITVVYYIMNTPETPDLTEFGVYSGLGWGFYLFFVGAIILMLTNFWSRMARPEK